MATRRTAGGRRMLFISTVLIFIILTFTFGSVGPRYSQIPNYAPLRKTTSQSRVAIVTFLAGDSDPNERPEDDFYFQAVRTLTYQILHDPETKSDDIPFLVLCTSTVLGAQLKRLELDGATVKVVPDITLPRWISTGVTRWKDQFTKLRIFEMVEYERVLFIDADTLITRPIDLIFDELSVQTPMTTLYHRKAEVKSDEMPLPSNYTFAARSDNAVSGERDHPFPPPPTASFSAGFWVASPSREMFAYLMSVTQHWRRFNPHTMEQSLLNYAFRRNGPMPWYELDYQWSATWPSLRDLEGGVASLHEKFAWTGPEELKKKWQEAKAKMEAFQKGRTS